MTEGFTSVSKNVEESLVCPGCGLEEELMGAASVAEERLTGAAWGKEGWEVTRI